MATNNFHLEFDAQAFETLGLITASSVLDVSLTVLVSCWTDKLIYNFAIQAREELISLWPQWERTHGRTLSNPPTTVTVMADVENCTLYVCASVKGSPYKTSFLEKLDVSHAAPLYHIMKNCEDQLVDDNDINMHKYQANCREIHAILQWHLKNPGGKFPKEKRRFIMATAFPPQSGDNEGGSETSRQQPRVVIYNPCGRSSDTSTGPPGCKSIVKELSIWAVERRNFEKAANSGTEQEMRMETTHCYRLYAKSIASKA